MRGYGYQSHSGQSGSFFDAERNQDNSFESQSQYQHFSQNRLTQTQPYFSQSQPFMSQNQHFGYGQHQASSSSSNAPPTPHFSSPDGSPTGKLPLSIASKMPRQSPKSTLVLSTKCGGSDIERK